MIKVSRPGPVVLRNRVALAAIVASLLAGGAFAQSPAIKASEKSNESKAPAIASGQMGDIVVTANRRSESVQSIPMSITALTAKSLEKSAANTFFDYATKIPNLSFTVGSAAIGRSVAIRGIADTGTTSFYIDDTPVSDGLDPKAIDVARIEVLRGPQGTLYGGRSEGGTLRLITEQPDPDKISGRAHVSLSNTSHTDRPNYQFDGALNLPIVAEKMAIRVSAIHEDEAGYFKRAIGPYDAPAVKTIKNVGEAKTDGASVAVLLKPTDRFSITPRALYQRTHTNGFLYGDVPIIDALAPLELKSDGLVQRRQTDVQEGGIDRWLLLTFDLKYRADIGTFSSASSYFHRLLAQTEDETDFINDTFGIAGLGTSEVSRIKTDGLTQEFRFASSFGGPIQIVTGLYYDRQKTGSNFPDLVAPGLNEILGGALGGDNIFSYRSITVQSEAAAFGEATWRLSDKFSLIGGLRYFRTKTVGKPQYEDGFFFGGPTVVAGGTQRENGVTPKASAQYRISKDAQVYFTAAKGFRPGGTNIPHSGGRGCDAELASLGVTSAQTSRYNSDSVWSYEVGAKTSWFRRHLTADASLFRIDWNKIQQTVGLQCGFAYRANAGSARSQGAELELNAAPFKGVNLSAGFGYTDAKFTSTAPGTKFVKGDRVSQVPRYTANASADYSFALTPTIAADVYADYKYVSNSLSEVNSPVDPSTGRPVEHVRPAYSIVDLRASLTYGKYELGLFVKNVTDKLASLGDPLPLGFSNLERDRVAVNQPRTIGIEGRVKF